MSQRAFIYACETLRLQQEDRFHVETPAEHQPTPQDLREKNAESMRVFQGMMSGVQGGPKVGR